MTPTTYPIFQPYSILELLFWAALFVVFYTYIGYGLLLYLLVKLKEAFRKPTTWELPPPEALPHVTLFITAYNEEEEVDRKMENALALDYPREKLHIVWVTDGTTDGTNQRLNTRWAGDATVLYQPERRGKTAAMTRGMKQIETPIVIFTDANTMLNREAVSEMVRAFENPKVGCVAGEKRIAVQTHDGAAAGGEGLYWRYESTLKALDARLYSAVGAAGELFAVRCELFEEMEHDTLLDDFVLSLRIAMKGHLIAYCSGAYAVESGSADMREEEKRKVRIAAGGLQSVWRLRELLNPLRYGVLSFQYVSHRVLRWSVTPVLLFALLPLNVALVVMGWANADAPAAVFREAGTLYTILLAAQVMFYLMGARGYYLSSRLLKNTYFFIPYYFLFMNINVFKGIGYLRRKKGTGTWERAKRA
ncbi:MAG: glycosyltransferase family 2 protein [Bacteroides sp.]|uniref:glycosyltransferase family 2 protein n=1 Tax=Bacteroides sp. TaxID=29523 RepID=UPI001B5CEA64|nr:glycosyltransferase family 2 protein [Bacteroides sp.]MBP9587391.1 glycosyltransferase family 2 protein [Bacteroides sp.]